MNYKIIILLLLMFGTQAINAQQMLSIKECRRKAVEYNKELKIAYYQKQEAIANKDAAKTAYLPSLSASAELMYMPGLAGVSVPGGFLNTAISEEAAKNGEFSGLSNVWSPGMNLDLGNLTIITGGVSVTQALYAGGKVKYMNKQAEAGVDIYSNAHNLKYSEIIEQTDQAYWSVVSVKANVKLAEKYIAMLTELEEQMTDMYNLGLTPASEKLKVSVQKNEAELNLLKANNYLKLSKMRLNHLIGQDLDINFQLANTLDLNTNLYDLSYGERSALDNRNELKILSKQLEISEYDKKLAMADYLPQLGVSASYSTNYIKDITGDMTFNPTFAGQLTIPIFQWGQGKHKQKAAKYKIDQSRTQLENTNELIKLEVQQVKVQIVEGYESIIIAKKNIKEAEESLEETKVSFEVGLNNTTDLLNAQAIWQSANAQLINSLAQYEVLHTAWLKVTGNLNP